MLLDSRAALLFALVIVVHHPVHAQEWRAYGNDPGGARFSPLTTISKSNVKELEVAWTFHTGDPRPAPGRKISFEATPIVVDGLLYVSTARGAVIALDPETGLERWRFNANVDPNLRFGDHTSRGVSTWTDRGALADAPCKRRIVFASVDARLFSLDATSGALCTGFGERGVVDLRGGLRNAPVDVVEYAVTSPPTVVNGIIIAGSSVADNNRIDGASGEVRAFDARTGALCWTWDPVPQVSTDPAYASWSGPNAHRTGAANTWSVIAADPGRDLVILPTSSPSPDYFGGERLGDNRYANSVVALRASTGKLVWHYQIVHHDLWDYDNASPPALVTITHNGRAIPAVIQGNKNGMLYVLDRRTGKPIFPIEERPVPPSDVPGESASPTQPFTTFLPPLVPHLLTAADAFGLDSMNRAWCANQFRTLRADGIYTPPSLRGTLTVPSNIGGAHWGGLVFDSASGQIIVPVNRLATLTRLVPRAQYTDTVRRNNRTSEFAPMRGTPYALQREILRSPSGLPCTSPPYGELVAVSTRTGRITWRIPLGGLGALAGSNSSTASIGSPNLGGPILTAGGLVFIAAALDSQLRAIDVATGAELWSGVLPGGGKATPMTFRGKSGRQYVVIAAGGDNDVWAASDALVAFALPITKR